jgi:Cysteine-rich secretory protein family/IPT/TIG domain
MGKLSRGILALGAIGLALYSGAPVFAQEIPSDAQEVLALVNQRRAEAGLRPLRIQPQLQQSAQKYAEQMAATSNFSHTGNDGSTPFSRMAAAGYRGTTMGENIARGFSNAESVMLAWMNSAGHRANILNPGYTEIGIGVATGEGGKNWVQDFGASEYEAAATETFASTLPPSITSVAPYYARMGDPITISGQRFGPTQGTVTFSGGQNGEISSWTDTSIVAKVPMGAQTGPLYVQNTAGTSPGAYFYVLAPLGTDPIVQQLSPPGGGAGSLVTIYGQRLGAAKGSVTFNGVPATILNWSGTGYYTQVLVPPGATTGPVVVTRGEDGKQTNALNFAVTGASAQPNTPTPPAAAPPTASPTPTPRPAYPIYLYRYRP